MKHTEKYTVDTHLADFNGIVSASGIFRFMQETANLQMFKYGPSNETLRSEGLAFILSRMTVSSYAPLYANEEITAETWPTESHGYIFNRCYRLLRGKTLIAEGASVWGLFRTEDKRPVKVDDIKFGFDSDEPLELDLPRRIRLPEGLEPVLVGERTVVYSDLDRNNHMNNTKYPDMLCDFLPGMQNKRVLSMTLSFVGEAAAGETLKIYRAESDGVFYFRTKKQDGGANIDAQLILGSI